MNARHVCAILVASCLVGGCGPKAGFLIRPVSPDEELVETVVSRDPGWFVTDKIAIVDVDGLILNRRGDGLFGANENPVSLFVEKIEKAQDDPDVRAVVLRINSPGGGVTATDLMYRRLAQLKAKRKVPVVAAIQDLGASGAYYLACGADAIVVAPTSVTGSIGVIVQTFNLEGTMAKLGVEAKAITSGPMKDMASPFKALDPEAEKLPSRASSRSSTTASSMSSPTAVPNSGATRSRPSPTAASTPAPRPSPRASPTRRATSSTPSRSPRNAPASRRPGPSCTSGPGATRPTSTAPPRSDPFRSTC